MKEKSQTKGFVRSKIDSGHILEKSKTKDIMEDSIYRGHVKEKSYKKSIVGNRIAETVSTPKISPTKGR